MALTRGSRSGDNPGRREVSPSGNFSVDGDKQERRRGRPPVEERLRSSSGGWGGHWASLAGGDDATAHPEARQTECLSPRPWDRFRPVESTQLVPRSQTPSADPPPTSQRLLPSARGCRLCGYPGSVALNTTSTPKGLLALRSPVKRGIHTRFPDVRGNPFRIEGVSKGPDPG